MAYLRKCDWCGREFISIKGFKVCGPICKEAKRLFKANEYAAAKAKKLAEAAGREYHPYKSKETRRADTEELRRVLFDEERKPKGCMFCSKVNSDKCGKRVFVGSLTGGVYKKIPDRRCDVEL